MATACETLAVLMAARTDLLTGKMLKRVRIQTGDVWKEIEYSASNLPALDREIARYRELCNAESGVTKPTRFAIRAG